MLVCDYIVEQIDGDYAHLKRVDQPEEELKSSCQSINFRQKSMRAVSFIMS